MLGFCFKGPVCKILQPLMVRRHIVSCVNVNPWFLMSCLILHHSCDVIVKSQNPEQLYVLSYCPNMVAQYGRLATSGPAPYVNRKTYY